MSAPPAPLTRFWEYKHAPLQLPHISDFYLPGLPTQPAIPKIQNSKGSEILKQLQKVGVQSKQRDEQSIMQ